MTSEERAAHLARELHPLRRPRGGPPVDAKALATTISRAAEAFRGARDNPTYQKASEWFLDNHHLLARAARQSVQEIPSGFWRRLPHAASADVPRVLVLARTFLDATHLEVDETALAGFVDAFQHVAPLSIAELWALPAMLRLATLEMLACAVRTFFPSLEAVDAGPCRLDPAVCIERSVRALRLFADVDWRVFFQHASVVDAALREDPAQVYADMVFESRDQYRKVVEEIAWETQRPEIEVARAAIELSSAATPDARELHVGYYLVDRGVAVLRRRVGHHGSPLARLRAAMREHPTTTYVGSIVALLALALGAIFDATGDVLDLPWRVATVLLLAIPISSVAVAWVNALVVRALPPRTLPRLDFSRGLPDECRTLVVVPALVAGPSDVDALLDQLERHFLSSGGAAVAFAVLSDFVDTTVPPELEAIAARADVRVAELNARHGDARTRPFHFLQRSSRWSPGERRFMGWERKRGKLEELHRLLRGDRGTSYVHHAGDPTGLERVRFVLTLDADTQLPLGAIERLVGLAAHPLNVAHFDEETGRVRDGYTVFQPRVETHPDESAPSIFGRICAGDTTLDIYTSAVSDAYQDLFGAGTYVGKGLYDVDAFARSVEGRVPENALCSHDLFEGAHGRVALASDVFVLEHQPQNVVASVRRQHRWIRGDWQIAPWLAPWVPTAAGWARNRLAAIDRWKIFDNLRRSLLAPATLAASVALAHAPRIGAAALVPLALPLLALLPELLGPRARGALAREALFVVLLPYEAWSALDAIARACIRTLITRRKMLEWTTAAATASAVARGARGMYARAIGPAAWVASVSLLASAWPRPLVLALMAPIALAWLASPEIARWLSAPRRPSRTVDAEGRRRLRRLARRTWAFFETFVTPEDQWLAPDNYQEEPGPVVAHRTSPTNVGLMLVAHLAALDFGYVGREELRALVQSGLDTLERLERYRGHLLNWYDTRTLAPLLPRYVSTVDSGNLAAALLVLARGLREAAHQRAVHAVRWTGLVDTLDLLDEALTKLGVVAAPLTSPLRRAVEHAERTPDEAAEVSARVAGRLVPELESALLGALGAAPRADDLAALRDVRTWFEGLAHQVRSLAADATASDADAIARELEALASRADALRSGMDFRFLYDERRKLFHIGYNATADRLDANHYDLLESEARIASFYAIVSRQVEPDHWARLGRPITRIAGRPALLSWGGTMFEYLMPSLFMRSSEGSLLAVSAELAVEAQMAWGHERRTAWGVSESGFARRDARDNYQYRSFGVPAIGIRRGLEDDGVIAPYASLLAVGLRPREVLTNLDALERLGALGRYGLYEAIDFESRDAPPVVVRSHMAHHQGMIFAALDNFLNGDVLVERFHADPRVRMGDAMLSERLPSLRAVDAAERLPKAEPAERPAAATPTFGGWAPDRGSPQLTFLGNGRLTTMLTDGGAGFVRWKGLTLIGVEDDPTIDGDGTWIYVRDESDGHVASATPAPTRPRAPSDEVLFQAHQVEIHHRDHGLSIRTEIGVAAHDDVEVRLVTLHNETDASRSLALRTFAEPVLATRPAARRHPAFSRMFVECERLDALHGVLAWRRAREANEPGVVMVQRLLWSEGAPVEWVGAETDRGTFIGRRRTARDPALEIGVNLPDQVEDATVDPAIALGAHITLAPRARVTLALVTSVAATREAVLDLSRRFGSLHAARWVMHDARRVVARQLDGWGMTPELLPTAMALASRLLLPATPLRPPPELRARAATRSELWGFGISGDDPLLVVRLGDPAESPLVRETLTLHRALRSWGVPFELVLLDETASGYQGDARGRLREVIEALGLGDRIGERAGIRLLACDQLAQGDRERLLGAASVLLDASRGSMAEQLAATPTPSTPLPDFVGTLAADPAPLDTPLPADLVLTGALGGFTADGREYVLRTDAHHAPPAPWCNVLANVDVGCLVSESSLGATWATNAGENRLTPWRNDPVSDRPAEVLYLRDEETAEVWSPTPLPAGLDAPTRVRHGAGYTVFERSSHRLTQTLTVFVPRDAPVKIVRLELTNTATRARRLTASYYAEWVLGVLREPEHASMRLTYDAAGECLLARSPWNHEHGHRVAFLSADRAPHGMTCDRTEWLGRGGTYATPRALARWGLSGCTEEAIDPCAVLQTHVDLAPGEVASLHFVLGQADDAEHAVALAKRFRSPHVVAGALADVRAYWDRLLGAVRVRTPSAAMDVMLNRWLLYQNLAARFLARTGFYQSSGAFGFRDQLQDTMGFVHVAPALAREHLLRAAKHQFEPGDVLHWWHPPADRGVRTRCSDDMLWLPFVVAHYVRVTGDRSVLDEKVRFLTGAELGPNEHDRYAAYPVSSEGATLLEHCRRAITRGATEGPHGLPLMGGGDWNDGMNRVGEEGRGESVWLAWFSVRVMRDFASLLETRDLGAEARALRERATRLAQRIDEVAWDGAWYLRAFYDDGTPLGTAKGHHCRIDSISQSWSVMAGGANAERVRRAVSSADRELVRERERLVLLLHPPFHGGLHHPGYIEAYPPGVRENGGQYTHAATWLGCAHAELGDGAAAERIFRLLNPILRSTDVALAERYRIEPYVLAGDVYGAESLTARGGWSWYTGAAAWMWRLGVEWILGLKWENGALQVDPCIPPEWAGFEAWVREGDREVHVVVDNPDRVARGVARIERVGDELRVTLGRAAVAAE